MILVRIVCKIDWIEGLSCLLKCFTNSSTKVFPVDKFTSKILNLNINKNAFRTNHVKQNFLEGRSCLLKYFTSFVKVALVVEITSKT